MKTATFNTNSVRARLPIILGWLAREQPDILSIQETKVQDKDFPVKALEEAGYRAVFRGQKSYNGVAVLSRSPLEDVESRLEVRGVDEARFISGRLGDVHVINVYVPQGFQVGSDKFQFKLAWLEHLYDYIQARHAASAPLLVTGDFNVACSALDVYDPETYRGEVGFHPDEQSRMEAFFDWGLVDIFRKHISEGGYYTFWDYRIPNGFKRNMGWRIDYILATPSLAEKSRSVRIDREARAMNKPSDHTFLVVEFDE